MTGKVTYEKEYKGLPILADKDKKQGCYTAILDRSFELLKQATDERPKNLFYRMDLHYPEGFVSDGTNKDLKKFINSYSKHLDRKKLAPKIIWTKEKVNETHQHYHIGVIIKSDTTQSPYNHIAKAKELWSKALGLDSTINNGLVHNCCKDRNGNKQKNCVILKKKSEDFKENFKSAFQRLSYLSKVSSKEHGSPHTFGTSALKKTVKEI